RGLLRERRRPSARVAPGTNCRPATRATQLNYGNNSRNRSESRDPDKGAEGLDGPPGIDDLTGVGGSVAGGSGRGRGGGGGGMTRRAAAIRVARRLLAVAIALPAALLLVPLAPLAVVGASREARLVGLLASAMLGVAACGVALLRPPARPGP